MEAKTLKLDEFVTELSKESGVSKVNVKKVLHAFKSVVFKNVKEGNTIHWFKMGDFYPKDLEARKIVDPQNPTEFRDIPARRKVGFEFSERFEELFQKYMEGENDED